WSMVASPISRPAPLCDPAEVSEAIVADTVEFLGDQGLIRFSRGDETLLAATIGIRRFGDSVEEQMVADFGTLNCEFVLLNLIEPWSRAVAALKIAQEGRMSAVSRFGSGGSDQYDAALQIIEGLDESRSALASYSMVLFVYGKTKEELAYLD